jgi:hypothetical protein
MPFLVRGKARARQNRAKEEVNVTPIPESASTPVVEPSVQAVKEEEKIAYQEVTYRVPKEERLLDLPLEEEVFGEENIASDIQQPVNNQPVGEPVSIGIALKKKKRR